MADKTTPTRLALSTYVNGHSVSIQILEDGALDHNGSRPNREWARIIVEVTPQNFVGVSTEGVTLDRLGAYNPVCAPDRLISYRFPVPTTRGPVTTDLWRTVAREEVEFLQQHRYYQADGKVIGSPNEGIPVSLPVNDHVSDKLPRVNKNGRPI
ncbi:MAG: hypothetical protein EBR99_00065 [Actinobacteria bacterium]|nr:hypothetical protein [Actinomycetota bacterium]